MAVHTDPTRIKIIGVIDNRAIDFYNFEAKFLVWASTRGQAPSPVTYGGQIRYGQNDFTRRSDLRLENREARLLWPRRSADRAHAAYGILKERPVRASVDRRFVCWMKRVAPKLALQGFLRFTGCSRRGLAP